jgi:hypothetical protein
LQIGPCDEARFLPDGGLLNYHDRGLYRWPIRHVADGTWRLGPAEPLLLNEYFFIPTGIDADASEHVVGSSDQARRRAVLLDPDRRARRTRLVEHRHVSDMAISPDGRWAATGSPWPGPDGLAVRVWETADGAPTARLEAGRVAFSSDGRWLGVVGRSGRVRPGLRPGTVRHGAALRHP